MKICPRPECLREYYTDYRFCPDCGEALQEEKEYWANIKANLDDEVAEDKLLGRGKDA